jgi:hypothetical protein
MGGGNVSGESGLSQIRRHLRPVFLCMFLVLVIFVSGCVTTPNPDSKPAIPTPAHPVSVTYMAANSTMIIPVLLTDNDWKIAGGCGWTASDLSETAALFMNDCQVRRLMNDGWEIVGIGYDMNFIGSRCKQSTHPEAVDSCDWCLDSGPTLKLGYKGIITTELLAHVREKTVTGFRTDLTGEMRSESTGDSERIVYRNGTVLYIFRSCNGTADLGSV